MQNLILIVVLTAVAIGTLTDIKKREVPDWITYALVIFGIGANLLYSITAWNLQPLIFSLVGSILFFAVAYVMFYTGQWGGGDSKLLIGIGASFGFPMMLEFPYVKLDSFMISFWFNLMMTGIVYATLWAVFVALRHRRKFTKEVKKILKQGQTLRRLILGGAIILLLASLIASNPLIKLAAAALAVISTLTIYLFVFSKAVERVGMLKRVPPEALTEGDWIAKEVIVDGEVITGPKDLGVSKDQISKLQQLHDQKKIKTVLIKDGIPFVPSFFLALLITSFYGNFLTIFFNVF